MMGPPLKSGGLYFIILRPIPNKKFVKCESVNLNPMQNSNNKA